MSFLEVDKTSTVRQNGKCIAAAGLWADKTAGNLDGLFEARLKNKVRDAFPIQKEAGYELPRSRQNIHQPLRRGGSCTESHGV